MVAVNPPLQYEKHEDPSYLRLSQSISQPEPIVDKSKAIGIKTLGDTLEGVAKGIDVTVKSDIDAKLYAKVDTERDAFTNSLERIRGELPGGPQGPLGPLNILPETAGQKPPERLQQGIAKVGDLNAGGEAGKVSDTMLDGRTLRVAKDLRSQYPGWRDYIDTKISEISGTPIANAYYRGLIHDMNQANANKNTEHNQILSLFHTSTHPNKASLYAGYITGNIPAAQVRYEIYKDDEIKNKNARIKEEATVKEVTDKVDVDNSEKRMDDNGSRLVENHISNVLIKRGGTNPAQIRNIIRDSLSKPNSMKQEDAYQLASEFQAARLAADQEFEDWGNGKVKSQDGKTERRERDILGPTKFNERKQAHLKQFDDINGYLMQGRIDLAGRVVLNNKARVADFLSGIQRDEDIGTATLFAQAMQDVPEFSRLFMQNSLMNKAPEQLNNYLSRLAEKMFTHPDYARTGRVETLLKNIEASQRREVQLGIKSPESNEYFLKQLELIKNPAASQDQIDKGLLSIYHPQNRGAISKFKDESQVNVFLRLTDKKLLEEAHKSDPQMWAWAQSWVLGSFGQELYKRDINDLSQLQSKMGVKVLWNKDREEWEVRQDYREQPESFRSRYDRLNVVPDTRREQEINYMRAVEAAGRINEGLKGVKNMFEVGGAPPGETSKFLLQTMKVFNYNFDNIRPGTIPEEMMQSLQGPGVKLPKIEDPFKNKVQGKTDDKVPAQDPSSPAPRMIPPLRK